MLDTDVLVAALRSPAGGSRWLLRGILQKELTIVVSVPLMLEYEAVLTRPEHLAIARLSTEEVSAVLDGVAAVGERTRFSFRWRPLLNDPDDEMVIETAINGGAQLLVSFNLRDFGSAVEKFACKAVRPKDAVEIIRNRLPREVMQ